jgi:hypothetical protein
MAEDEVKRITLNTSGNSGRYQRIRTNIEGGSEFQYERDGKEKNS